MEQAADLGGEAADETRGKERPEGSDQVPDSPDAEVRQPDEGEASEESPKGQEPEEAKDSPKKGFFGKKKEKKDPKDAQIEELTDRRTGSSETWPSLIISESGRRKKSPPCSR